VLRQHALSADRCSPLLNTSKSPVTLILACYMPGASRTRKRPYWMANRVWTEVSVQVFEFFFVLISLLQKSLNRPYIFFATKFIMCLLCHRSIIQNTSHFCDGSVSICFVIIQLFRSPVHFVSTERSQSSLWSLHSSNPFPLC
jgi:hypothetical protein